MDFLDRLVLGNPIKWWLIAAGAAFVAFQALLVVRRIVVQRLSAWAAGTKNAIDDVVVAAIGRTRVAFIAILAVWIGTLFLFLPEPIRAAADAILVVALIVQAALWANRAIDEGVAVHAKRAATGDTATLGTVTALGFIGRLVLWAIVFLLVLDNVGVDVTALIAGLGIGGIAVALAAQNILSDLFASLSIMFDKPFIQGDFIIVGDVLGTVEYIGVKTTRLRSLGGEQIIISNADLLASRIKNYKRMVERRVVFSLGVGYDTPPEKLEAIPGMLKGIIEAQPRTRFDRAHWKTFGAYSLDFEVVYVVLTPEIDVYMNVQQAINLAILRRFREAEIDIAYPTQVVIVNQQDARS